MRVALLHPRLPPALDGVGDHTRQLARALVASPCVDSVRVLGCSPADPSAFGGGVALTVAEGPLTRAVPRLMDAARGADWLLLQYTGFTYGRYGVRPGLLRAVRRLQRQGTRVALIAHEAYVPPRSPRLTALWLAQGAQFQALGRLCDHVFTTTEPWAERYSGWFGRDKVSFLRIGSNIAEVPATTRGARLQLGLPKAALIAVVFGGLGTHRDAGVLRAGLHALASAGAACAVYVGPDGRQFRSAAAGTNLPVVVLGTLPAEGVSLTLRAADLALAPFIDGVSSRRTSFLACLQHGVATVTTTGPLTGPELLAAGAAGAFAGVRYGERAAFADAVAVLASNAERRQHLGATAADWFQQQRSWPVIAGALLTALARQPVEVDA